MTESDAVRAANLEFYRAFTTRDIKGMDRIWARNAMILCTHPGWVPLSGRAAVMASWRNILANPDAPAVMCHDDIAFLYGEIAVVLCEEELSGGHLAATNVFIKEDGDWRIMHHHASPILTRALPQRRRSVN
ncbi:MAG TPA: nuclear transport factor 2 family protein [Stellaceae bacterium]|nr:nuclear transport factor 2 family protein [Stellaceae bacterium]